MEIDTPTTAPLMSAHAVEEPSMAAREAGKGAIDRVFNLDEYLSQNPPAAPQQSSTSHQPLPRAVGARSSRHTILLHEKYQALAIPQPVFSFSGGSELGWAGKVVFLDEEVHEGGPFNSKQEAKEALSKRALAVLERLEREGKVARPEKGKRQKVAVQEVVEKEKEKKEQGPNYVGQLLGMLSRSRFSGLAIPSPTNGDVGSHPSVLPTTNHTCPKLN